MPAGAALLGKAKGRTWAALPHPAKAAPGLSLAYLDVTDFREGTKGLRATEIAAVMGKRAGAQDQVLSDLADDLALAAGSVAARRGTADPAWTVFLEGYGMSRPVDANPETLLRALELRTESDALERETAGADTAAVREAFERTRTALIRAAAALGKSIPANVPMVTQNARAVFLAGSTSLLQDAINRHEIRSEKVKGGRLALLNRSQMETVRDIEKPIVVYVTASDYARASNLLTPAQLQARVTAAVKNHGPGAAAYQAATAELRLSFCRLVSAFLAVDRKLPAAERDSLVAIVQVELPRTALLQGPAGAATLGPRLETLAAFATAAGEKDLAAWAARSASRLASEAKP